MQPTIDELIARLDALLAHQERLLPSQSQVTNAALTLANSVQQLTKRYESLGDKHDASRLALVGCTNGLSKVIEQLVLVNQNRDTDTFATQTLLREINTNLALMGAGVKEVERDVREATDPRLRLPVVETGEQLERRKPVSVQAIEAFAKMPRVTQGMLIVLVLAVTLGGWLSRLLGGGG